MVKLPIIGGVPRRVVLAAGVYALTTAVYFAFADTATLTDRTRFNHFALLGEAWLNGQLDLGHPPPAYTGNNDFALYDGRWFIVFPPFPAVLLLPLVWLAGSAETVNDGQFFLWLAGIGPAVLFLALEKLGRMGIGSTTRHNLLLAALFAFGTVYFFVAEQGTVWFAAHVVGVALAALYLLFSLDAARPVLAGVFLGLAFLTRAPLALAFPLFVMEALRVSRTAADKVAWDWKALAHRLLWFSVPLVTAAALALWYNAARFGDPTEFGYRYLQIVWRSRIETWGLFSYHYLAKNLGVLLTSLPYVTRPPAEVPFQVNGHGLALWVTSPFYLWLFWSRTDAFLKRALWLTVACVALVSLFYQNTGWVQFGYRFSNDYAVFLFALLGIARPRWRGPFALAAIGALIVNGFGAATFGRSAYSAYYFVDATQRIVYQPD
jgi:hypothetical protein